MKNDSRLSDKGRRAAEPPISWLMKTALDRPGLVSLAAGFTSNDAMPVDDVAETIDEILRGDPAAGARALQYGSTIGREPLRRLVLDRLGRQDGIDPAEIGIDVDDVVLTSGSQQLLYLVADVLIDPGDVVIVGAPTYFVFLGILDSLGARAVSVPLDADGLQPDALEAAFEAMRADGRLDRVKMVYLVPYYQNPSGATIPAARKRRIYEILERYRRIRPFYVVEDAAYRDMRFSGDDVMSIKSLDRDNSFVVYAATFTKPLATGLKSGYGILPHDLVDPVLRQKGSHDFGSAHFNQAVVERYLETGRYDRGLERLRRHYAEKMAAMDEAMHGSFPTGWRWDRPDGGLYIWAVGPADADTGADGALFARALDEGVLYVPGAYCYGSDPDYPAPASAMRLSFGHPPVDAIREGIARLGRALAGHGAAAEAAV